MAFTKIALARALNDNGQTEEALKEAKEAWVLVRPTGIPARAAVEYLSHIASYASILGFDNEVSEVTKALDQLSEDGGEAEARKNSVLAHCAMAGELRRRFAEILKDDDPAKTAGTEGCTSLPDADAVVTRPLLRLWEEMPEALPGSYDFWGRGNFGRMLRNTRSFRTAST